MRYLSKSFTHSLRFVIALSLFLFAFITTGYAQNIDFDNISLEEGLSQSVVTSIAQDDMGFLWLATQSGLNRYDGKSFSLFTHNPDDSTSISNNWVTTLLNEPGKPILWVGTSSGFNKFNLETESFERYGHVNNDSTTISNGWINDLYRDQNGILWIATQGGLNRFNPETEQMKRIPIENKQWDQRHSNIVALTGINNEVWLASPAGLLIYDTVEQSYQKPQSTLLDDNIMSLHQDADSTVWAGSSNGKVLAINAEHQIEQSFSTNNGILNAPVQAINKDKDGNLWIGTIKGLNIFNPDRDIMVNTIQSKSSNPNSLSTPDVRDIFIDQSSVVWVSTYEGGVNKTNVLNNQFEHYKMDASNPDALHSNQTKTIVEDDDGNIWIGTSDQGIEKFDVDQNTFSHYPHDPADPSTPSSNFIKRMYVSSRGYLWVAANGVGMDRFDLDTWSKRTYTPEDGLAHKDIWAIQEDDQGYMWFGTYGGGANRFDPRTGTFKTLKNDPNDPNSLSNNFVTAIYPQSQDSIWLGTQGGLNIYNANTGDFTIYKSNPEDSTSLSDGPILDIHEGPTGDIWLATYGGGIDRFDVEKKTFKHYREKDGLAHNSTYNFLEDGKGNLWVSNNNGISRINPYTDQITNYSTSHGLQSKEFSNGAYEKTDEGIMYFGGINGFNRFDPAKITEESNGPKVAITQFALFNNEVPIGPMEEDGRTILEKSVSYTSELDLSYKDYVFSFEFAALNFAYPEQNKFSYKMVGLEDKWNDVGNRNYVSYTNMPPGEYTFKVKAADYNGVWSQTPASIKLNVAPPFWQTTWFYILSLVIILASIYGIYRYRVQSIQNRNQELAQKVNERTEELNEKNKDLENTLQELEDTKDELVQKARKAGMADIATGVLHNVGNILNSINTSSSIMEQTLRNSKVEGLQKANNMLRDNMNNIEEFITENPKGKKLLSYYLKIEDLLLEEQQTMLKHNFRLNEKIHLINDVISTQQSYAGTSNYTETVRLEKMIDNALTLQAGSIEQHDITVEQNIDDVPEVEGQRTQVVHILVNLIKNAKEAMGKADNDLKDKIAIDLYQENSSVVLKVSDTGHGISEEELDKIFTHGFTTKEDGHGFGLHSCSNYMNEMGGNMTVESEGEGKGATFTLKFPTPSTNNGASEEE
ncbi:ligand-binding sensor domain-containing protein [Fodinibius salinus]|uniref:histidine kinase n=1 Tax=Fodinibius salinus TaxID=860790 RepID=A0A5D3YHY3_9BACT|nr:sensor histidine kinase [Fodinibius salinus]TYP93514.1 ligand-binding sensor domain-containing protein [Fodinibius salinus]